MPYKSRRQCLFPGCYELVNAGERYCAKHRKQVPSGGDASHYDRRWQRIRIAFLSKHPLCQKCKEAGKLTPATEVHHIIAVKNGGSDADENLMPLCKSCHSRITREEMGFGL